jgi:hypothetical protein
LWFPLAGHHQELGGWHHANTPGGVPDTDPDPREARRIREKQNRTRVWALAPSPHRATRAASIRKPLADPSGRVAGMQVKIRKLGRRKLIASITR